MVAVFCMPENGHFQRIRPLVAGLAGAGLDTRVFTHARFAGAVRADGGRFVDLFERYPLEALGDDSLPVPSRFVTFAAAYAESVAAELDDLGTRLVVHDSFAVIGRVAAALRGLPTVNVCAGHNVLPERFARELRADPRVRTSAACRAAVQALKSRFGMADASPFSYLSPPSPQLNICCEPPEFFDEAERQAWQPVAFFGSLRDLPSGTRGPADRPMYFDPAADRPLKLYVSFGTVIWRYYAETALRALHALADAIGERPGWQAVIGLGGSEAGRAAAATLARRNVRVEDYVDQQACLAEADLFVTHHGLNSTHEAIAHGVPMLSCPFFWDQPALARKCRDMGLALPLVDALREPLDRAAVHRALDCAEERGASMRAALARAQDWERAVIASRPGVIRRIVGLIG